MLALTLDPSHTMMWRGGSSTGFSATFGRTFFCLLVRVRIDSMTFPAMLRSIILPNISDSSQNVAITGQKPFLALLFIKFLYGTRILTILYLSIRKVHYPTFFLFNTIGTVFWLLVMIFVGWLVGRGTADAGQVFSRVEYTLTALVLLIVLYRIITTWLGKEITKK